MKNYFVIFSLIIISFGILFFEFESNKMHVGVAEAGNKSLVFQKEIEKSLNGDILNQDIHPKKYTNYQLMLFTIRNPNVDEKLKELGFIKRANNEFCRDGELVEIDEKSNDDLKSYLLSWSFPDNKCIN